MTRPDILPKNRLIPARAGVALLLVLAVLLLAAGCESQAPAEEAPSGITATKTLSTIPTRHIATTIRPAVTLSNEPEPVPVLPAIEESESHYQVTVTPSINYRPEYIRMDETAYAAGEVVQFYLVNKGPEINGCDYAHPAYTIFHLSPDGTRMEVSRSDPARSYFMVMVEGEPGSATGPLSLDTRRLPPGRYLIRFDCGNNVAREFVIQERSIAAGL